MILSKWNGSGQADGNNEGMADTVGDGNGVQWWDGSYMVELSKTGDPRRRAAAAAAAAAAGRIVDGAFTYQLLPLTTAPTRNRARRLPRPLRRRSVR